jgi:pimeloyl-ACP methyl ester carboxylesterase
MSRLRRGKRFAKGDAVKSGIRIVLGWLSVALLIALSSACRAAPPADVHTKVYLLRGLTNVLSPGIDQLADELQHRNISATVSNHLFWSAMADQAIEDCRSGRVNTVVLVGHSLGASAALDIADRMRKAGLRVALIATLDPVLDASVPDNVHLLRNFYLSNGFGKPVAPGQHFHGLLQNVDLNGKTELGHVFMTTEPAIRSQIMSDILAAGTRCR